MIKARIDRSVCSAQERVARRRTQIPCGHLGREMRGGTLSGDMSTLLRSKLMEEPGTACHDTQCSTLVSTPPGNLARMALDRVYSIAGQAHQNDTRVVDPASDAQDTRSAKPFGSKMKQHEMKVYDRFKQRQNERQMERKLMTALI